MSGLLRAPIAEPAGRLAPLAAKPGRMTRPKTILALSALLACAAAVAGCAAPDENAGQENTDTSGQVCAPGSELGGESGMDPGATGSGTGDITTADGGDPTRPTVDDPCGPTGAAGNEGMAGTDSGAGTTTGTDGTSTGLGEHSGGYSTAPQ
jgi:hypothetical protein